MDPTPPQNPSTPPEGKFSILTIWSNSSFCVQFNFLLETPNMLPHTIGPKKQNWTDVGAEDTERASLAFHAEKC